MPRLSVCIATFNRADYIGETLASIVPQLGEHAELVIVDGASADRTSEVVAPFLADPRVRYVREAVNSGVDADFDKAVGHARGEHCWLMTDDDLLRPGAIDTVLAALAGDVDAIVVNVEVRNRDLSKRLTERQMALHEDATIDTAQPAPLLREAIQLLTFIGCLVVRRAFWLQRRRTEYYGSLFIHVGVLFQSPAVPRLRLIAEPQVILRYGNAMWTPRSFEIWMFKWPALVWSFDDLQVETRAAVVAREPWRRPGLLLINRAAGAYTSVEYARFLHDRRPRRARAVMRAIALLPARWVNFAGVVFLLAFKRWNRVRLHDLLASRHASDAGRYLARLAGRDVL